MSNKIKLKRGLKSNLPILDVGEPAFTTDEKNVYIGSSDGNIKLASAEHDHDVRYYTKEYMSTNFPSQLPFKATKVLYDSSVDTEALYPGDVFNCDFSSYATVEIWGKIPSSQFHIVIDLGIETSTFTVDHYEASDYVRRMTFNGDSLGAMTSITCSVNKLKQQLKFHGVCASNVNINGATEDETRHTYQICKIVAVKYPSSDISSPLIS